MRKLPVQWGLSLANRGALFGLTNVDELIETAVAAERSGVFESVWVGDSLTHKPRLEAITLLRPDLSAGELDQSLARSWPAEGLRPVDSGMARYGHHHAGVALYVERSARTGETVHPRSIAAFAVEVTARWLIKIVVC